VRRGAAPCSAAVNDLPQPRIGLELDLDYIRSNDEG
jgi:hypothetical protein